MNITLFEFEHYLGKLNSCTLSGDVDGYKDAVARVKELWGSASEQERETVIESLQALRASYSITN